jgi:hypothetical protein
VVIGISEVKKETLFERVSKRKPPVIDVEIPLEEIVATIKRSRK